MGRYLKLLEEARAKRAKETCDQSATKVHERCDNTPLVALVASVADPNAQIGAKHGANAQDEIGQNLEDLSRSVKPIKTEKHNNINDIAFTDCGKSFDAADDFLPRAAETRDQSDQSDQSPFWNAFVEFRDACQNVALNHKYVMALADATTFLRDWGAQAEALGWAAEDLFGLDPVAPLGRYDAMGLVWMLAGQRVVTLTDEAAAIKASSGSLLKFYRRDVSHKWAQRVSDRSAG